MPTTTSDPSTAPAGDASSSGSVSSVRKGFLKDLTGDGNLFFVRRHPHLRGGGIAGSPPLKWQPPLDPAVYQKMLDDDDFISIPLWKAKTGEDLSQYPVMVRDLEDLDQHLLPMFFNFSERSRFYQNRFYLYQWVFILGAFLTTVFGVISVYESGTGQGNSSIMWSLLTAGVGLVTTIFTALSNRDNPGQQWARYRRLAEQLRGHYFKYLAHVPPYDQGNALQKLRQNVFDAHTEAEKNV